MLKGRVLTEHMEELRLGPWYVRGCCCLHLAIFRDIEQNSLIEVSIVTSHHRGEHEQILKGKSRQRRKSERWGGGVWAGERGHDSAQLQP